MADVIFDYSYATNNAAPPGNQQIRLNQTASTAATAVYVDDQDSTGATVRTQLLATAPGSQLTVVSGNNAAVFATYILSAATGRTGYVEFTVAYLQGSGTIQNGSCTLELTAAATGTHEVISFVNFRPPPRYDNLPFTNLVIEESVDGLVPWTQIDTFPLTPVDADPTHPQLRSFTTEKGTALNYWYRITFRDATGDESPPTIPIQNTGPTAVTPVVTAYAPVDELFRVLKIRAPSVAQTTAGQRVLDTAALEIDSELGLTAPYADPPALVVEVNLERAVEHWSQQESPFGIIGLGEATQIYTARDSWDRHALKLAPLKMSWGCA